MHTHTHTLTRPARAPARCPQVMKQRAVPLIKMVAAGDTSSYAAVYRAR